MSARERVDCQIHIWKADRPQRPWPDRGWDGRPPRPHRDMPLEPGEVLSTMERAQVHRAVLIPPSWEGYYNDAVLAAARRWPKQFAAMGRWAPGTPLESLRAWRDIPGMLGIRLIIPPDGVFAKADVGHPFWRAAEDAGIPLMVHAVGNNALVARIADRHPDLRMALDHMGTGLMGPDLDEFMYEDDVLALASRRNVAVKLSAVPCHSRRLGRPWSDMTPRIKRLIDAFGPERCFWGSDLSRLPCDYTELVDYFEEDLDWLSEKDLDLIMGQAVLKWLDWR